MILNYAPAFRGADRSAGAAAAAGCAPPGCSMSPHPVACAADGVPGGATAAAAAVACGPRAAAACAAASVVLGECCGAAACCDAAALADAATDCTGTVAATYATLHK